jgi:hypothetical protein
VNTDVTIAPALVDDPHPLRVVDSITELGASDQGCIAVSGSHGGLSSARYALVARPWLTVFNDAGVGRNGAGIAALACLQQQGLAACTVAHTSACIGQAESTWQHGVVSHVNAAAYTLGLRTGTRLAEQVCNIHPGAGAGKRSGWDGDNAGHPTDGP